jgi:Asp-tRNA(Asn)/Glu-tRNA(Gln) amidotransferase A subunit family amidase
VLAVTSEFRPDRRKLLLSLGALGTGAVLADQAPVDSTAEAQITKGMVNDAEWIAGVELTDGQRQLAAEALENAQRNLQALRAVDVDYSVGNSLVFRPLYPSHACDTGHAIGESGTGESAGDRLEHPVLVQSPDELAALPVTQLAQLIRSRQITSTELTKLSLDRLRRFDPLLKCVVTLTEELALRQAAAADDEISRGHYRGPLHGIPWGAKDLIAVPGYPTTWGAPQFKDQRLSTTATVARKLDDAGAVLVAKLSMGALALGDEWFRGRTRNPWDPRQGSSGSSAGSAAASVAALVGFTLGSETLGSIISPSRRCGATGLRPTFGRVSRHGCMSLCWSLDKIGPICRSVADCALVLQAIHGADPQDMSTVSEPFTWPAARPLSSIRVGYIPSDEPRPDLQILEELGCQLVAIELPNDLPVEALHLIVSVESGSVFDELTRRGEPKGVRYWPRTFAMAQFISANDYLRANRVRMMLMQQMDLLMRKVDVYVAEDDLTITNMTGHPQIALPGGFRDRDGFKTPTAITFTGRLYDESTLLTVADAYQRATGFHLQRPPIDDYLARIGDFDDPNEIAPVDRLDGT